MNKKIKLQGYNNAFVLKARNRRVEIVRQELDGKDGNVIRISSLTSETGKVPGAITEISKNGKVKYALIGLSDEAIKELHTCLHHYLDKIL